MFLHPRLRLAAASTRAPTRHLARFLATSFTARDATDATIRGASNADSPADLADASVAPAVVTTTPTGVRLTAHTQYHAARLSRASLPPDPLALFRSWLSDALTSVREPEAMTLCTSTPGGVPSARTVLLKEVDELGFVFFTNYGSRKGAELHANPHAALAMHWRELARQVRVVGPVGRVSREESESYFATRPRGSQVGAWASAQSSVVQEGELEAAVAEAEARFDGVDAVPCPPGWGGFRVIPT